jgi:hypothetical protein
MSLPKEAVVCAFSEQPTISNATVELEEVSFTAEQISEVV